MITVLIGEINECNRFRIEEIKMKYPSSLIINRSTSKGFKIWLKNIKRPIIGDRILLNISDTTPITRRDFDAMRDILNNIADHNYIDVLWLIPSATGDFRNIVTELNVIILKDTYRNDFETYVQSKFPKVGIDQVKYLLKRIAYSWNTYILYQEELLAKGTFTNKDIDHLITTKALTPLMEVLYANLVRSHSGLREYYSYCERYSTTWLKNFYIENLEKILELKFMYYKNNTITMAQIKNSDKYRKYYKIVSLVPITEIYLLLLLLRTENYPVEVYYNNSSRELVEKL